MTDGIKLLILSLLLFSCKENKEIKQVSRNDILKTPIKPFALENINFKCESDTSLQLHFNREIDSTENLYFIMELLSGDKSLSSELLPLIDTKNKIMELKFPYHVDEKKLKFLFGENAKMTDNFNLYLQKYIHGDAKINTITLRLTPANTRIIRFKKGIYSLLEDYKNFRPDYIIKRSKKVSRNGLLSNDLLRFYKGNFDAKGRKQGSWEWYYSNRSILAKAVFKNDSLVGNLYRYDFYGKICDTLSEEKQ